jgi:RluA family pseudouridine synthase
MTPGITNIAAYRFAELEDLKSLRTRLQLLCREQSLKGTILLSTEGVNLFVAGAGEGIERLLAMLRALPGLEALEAKYSFSGRQPFSRMLVRIKKEIIAFGVPGISPARHTSPKLAPSELKRWLDEGRPVTLLDTRNDYEVKLGTFRGALTLDLKRFRDFPEAVAQLPGQLKSQPVVMFCTGGIRCEKAGPFMEQQGFQSVHQLKGGILRYFEDCGGAHYDGECFVFDQRVGVDPALDETESAQCYRCLSPLTPSDQADSRHVPGVSCPFCHRTPAEELRERIAERERVIQKLVSPLPGAHPVENFKPFSLPARVEGWPLAEAMAATFPGTPPHEWALVFENDCVLRADRSPALPHEPASSRERYLRRLPADREPDVAVDIRLVHDDEALIVVNKPAPLPVHPSGRFCRNTLQSILQAAYAPAKPRPAHRLDANTSGLIVFTKARRFAGILQPAFERGEVRKNYLLRVVGHPVTGEFVCTAPVGEDPQQAGARRVGDPDGLPARTEFRVLERFCDGTALLEARPLTGRTNQIRLHAWHLGHAILGDPLYRPGGLLGTSQTLDPADAPMCLHAHRLSFAHPVHGTLMEFEAPAPGWAGGV